jgi:hypothetical protein
VIDPIFGWLLELVDGIEGRYFHIKHLLKCDKSIPHRVPQVSILRPGIAGICTRIPLTAAV